MTWQLIMTVYAGIGALTTIYLIITKRLEIHPAFKDLSRPQYHFSMLVNVLGIMIASPLIILALGFELVHNSFFED